MRHILTITMITVIVSLGICTSVFAANSQKILAEVRQSDDALRQGTIIYDETSMSPPDPKSKSGPQTTNYQLYYTADGRNHQIPEDVSKHLEIVSDKNCGFTVSKNNENTEIMFSSNSNFFATRALSCGMLSQLHVLRWDGA